MLVGGATIPVSGADGSVQEFPIDTVNTANLKVTVLAKDGLTIAVGGMIRESVSKSIQKVPFLGDIPFLGVLFRREVRNRIKTETDEETERDAETKTNQETREYSVVPRGEDEQMYIDLIRYAASQMAGEYDAVLPTGVTAAEIPIDDFPDLLKGVQVLARPLAAWRRDEIYVTTVRLNNPSTQTVVLDPLALNGRWLAASFEQETLLWEGEGEQNNIAYLISDRPFAQALMNSQEAQ